VLVAGRLVFTGTAAAMTAAHGGAEDGTADAAERAFMRMVSGDEDAA
jgi:hypothetical protein